MTNPIKIALYKPTDKFVHIDDIIATNKVLRNNCCCLKCDEKLEAVLEFKNKNRIRFFRHSKNIDCRGSQETALHELAKQIIVNNSRMSIPKHGVITYSEPIPEKKFEKIQPDVTAICDGKSIYFEIFVSHAVDEGKEKFLKEQKLRSMEIDLSKCPTSSFEQIKVLVIDEISNKKVFHWLDDQAIHVETNTESWTTQLLNFSKEHLKEILALTGIFVVLKILSKRKR